VTTNPCGTRQRNSPPPPAPPPPPPPVPTPAAQAHHSVAWFTLHGCLQHGAAEQHAHAHGNALLRTRALRLTPHYNTPPPPPTPPLPHLPATFPTTLRALPTPCPACHHPYLPPPPTPATPPPPLPATPATTATTTHHPGLDVCGMVTAGGLDAPSSLHCLPHTYAHACHFYTHARVAVPHVAFLPPPHYPAARAGAAVGCTPPQAGDVTLFPIPSPFHPSEQLLPSFIYYSSSGSVGSSFYLPLLHVVDAW